MKLMTYTDPMDMFDALDVDGSGEVGIDEFCAGIQQVAISNTPIEIKRMERQIESIFKQLKRAQHVQERHQNMLEALLEDTRGAVPPELTRGASPGDSDSLHFHGGFRVDSPPKAP